MAIGGLGGFFASVRACGVTGQQQQPINVSAEDTLRGGGGGIFRSFGGGTKPGSSEPSPPASTVPAQSVTARMGMTRDFVVFALFILQYSFSCPLATR